MSKPKCKVTQFKGGLERYPKETGPCKLAKKTTKAPVNSLGELPAQSVSARNFIFSNNGNWFRKFWAFYSTNFSIFSKNRFAILLENFKIGLVKIPKIFSTSFIVGK